MHLSAEQVGGGALELKHIRQVPPLGDVAAEPSWGGERQPGDPVPGSQGDQLAGMGADLLLGCRTRQRIFMRTCRSLIMLSIGGLLEIFRLWALLPAFVPDLNGREMKFGQPDDRIDRAIWMG